MKAYTYYDYGGPEVLGQEEVPVPEPKHNEILIKVKATSVNAKDWRLMSATPWLARLAEGFFKPKNAVMGSDIAGTVEKVGSQVAQFKVGDEVLAEVQYGAFAEYAVAPESNVASKPQNLSFNEAAALPLAASTAYQALESAGDLKGKAILVNGSTGGVGGFAVQIAKAGGAQVIAICSKDNIDLVRSYGADQIIDYTNESPLTRDEKYDVIVDTVGNYSIPQLSSLLNADGKGLLVGFTTVSRLLSNAIQMNFVGKKQNKSFKIVSASPSQDTLESLAELARQKKLKPHLDKVYPFAELPKALEHIMRGHVKGKIVVEV